MSMLGWFMNRRPLVWAGLGLLVVTYHLLNPLRLEHLLMLFGAVVAWNIARIGREFILVFLPLILFGWLYDLLRIFASRAVQIVTIAEVREAELFFFGWWRDGERVGPVEFFVDHHHPFLDLLGAPVYSSHVGTIIVFGLLLWWRTRVSSLGEVSSTLEPDHGAKRLHRFLWGFLFLNLVGFAVQILYPVAPPWYVELHGYTMPEGAIMGNPAGLVRVDELIGIDYFQGIYGKAAYVFGAMPSLHVAYPVWLALHVRSRFWKIAAWAYAGLMAFFAVYFIHHYVVDVVAGAGLSAGVYLVLTRTPLGTLPEAMHRRLVEAFLPGHGRPAEEVT